MRLEFISKFEEVIAKLNNSESLDFFHRIMISTRPIDMDRLVESIKNTKHNVIALTINSIKLTGDEIKKLEDVFTHCASLENLDLSNNDLTSKEAEILAGILANNKTINSLSLNNNKIGDNGLKAFAKIAENSSIENLNFSDNNISDIGFKYWLAAHKKNTSLTNFNFHNNKIHNEGIQTLIHFLKFNDSVKSFHVGTEWVEEPNTTNVTLETRRLLTKLVEEKEIEAFLKTSDTLLPDALDVWEEEVNPPVVPKWVLKSSATTQENLKVEESIPKKTTELENRTQSVPISKLPLVEPEQQQPISRDAIFYPVQEQTQRTSESEQIVKQRALSPSVQIEARSTTQSTTLESNKNKFNPETTLELLDKYGIKFKTALEKGEILDKLNIKSNTTGKEEQKALIILGHPGSGKTTLANLFAVKTLTVYIDEKGKLLILQDSLGLSSPLDYSSSNKATINIAKVKDSKNKDLIICESNYLYDKLFTPEKIINEFYITKILSNYPTKFIVTIKDSKLEREFLPLTKNLATLLKNVTLSSDSLSLVITKSPTHKNSDHIFNTLVSIIYHNQNTWLQEKEALGKKQIDIVDFLAESTSMCLFPAFSPGTINLDNFKNIFKFPPLIKEDNKIAVGSTDISDILTLQSYIKEGLKDGISKLNNKIKTKWEEEKASLFTLKTTSNIKELKKLQGIFKWLKKPGNDSSNNNIIDNDTAKFLALNNALYEVLRRDKESNELNDKLSSYVDYLKYFTAISVDNRENINTNMHDNWFEMLTKGILPIGENVNKQLIEAFKDNIQRGNEPFYKKLELALKDFCNSIENIKKLTPNTLNNIDCLKNLQEIFTTKEISSFTIIEDNLFKAVNILFLNDNEELNGKCLKDFIKYNITILTKLIEKPTPEILNEIWQEFTGSVPVSTNINEIIYNKLLTAIIEPGLSMGFYSQLEELLKCCGRGNESNPEYKEKMVEIFENCNLGGNTVGFAQDSIE